MSWERTVSFLMFACVTVDRAMSRPWMDLSWMSAPVMRLVAVAVEPPTSANAAMTTSVSWRGESAFSRLATAVSMSGVLPRWRSPAGANG
jgi:hypothetical protein